MCRQYETGYEKRATPFPHCGGLGIAMAVEKTSRRPSMFIRRKDAQEFV